MDRDYIYSDQKLIGYVEGNKAHCYYGGVGAIAVYNPKGNYTKILQPLKGQSEGNLLSEAITECYWKYLLERQKIFNVNEEIVESKLYQEKLLEDHEKTEKSFKINMDPDKFYYFLLRFLLIIFSLLCPPLGFFILLYYIIKLINKIN